jgi:hypothetical protein
MGLCTYIDAAEAVSEYRRIQIVSNYDCVIDRRDNGVCRLLVDIYRLGVGDCLALPDPNGLGGQ